MEDISEDHAASVLQRAEVGHVAVIADGRPYVTPISFVFDRGSIYMRMFPGRRLSAIKVNPEISFEVVSYREGGQDWDSVVVSGSVAVVEDANEVTDATQLLLEKYRTDGVAVSWGVPELVPGRPEVVRLVIAEMTVRTSGTGLGPRIRPGRL